MGDEGTRTLDSAPRAPRSPPPLVIGERIGRYEIHRCIDRGGMGVVYEATDGALDRRVAIKRLLAGRDPADAARLVREARALAGLSHPNVVTIYEVGVVESGAFLAMELVDGVSLAQWLETPRSPREIVRVFAEAGRGLAAAHRAGLVHRDVKPGNILVGTDRVRIADFGLARAATEDHDGAIVGTPAYMAPEQREGRAVDARADQFAFCVSLAEALGPKPPAWLARIIERGRHVDVARRYPSMDALLRDLERDRGTRLAIVAAGAGGVAAASVIAVALLGGATTEPSPPPCLGIESRIAGTWNEATRTELAAAFGRLPAKHAAATGAVVTDELDRYADRWIAMGRDACEATRVRRDQSEELLDRRNACLDQRRAAFAVVVQAFLAIDDAALASAPGVARGLPRIEDCADHAYVARAATTPRATELGEELMKAKMLYVAGRDRDGLVPVERAIAIARELGDRVREAEALVLMGRLQTYPDAARAVETLTAAVELAGKTSSVGTRVDAWMSLSQAYQFVGQMQPAAQVLELGFAALREAPDRWREADLLLARGTLYGRTGKFEDARRDFARALALWTEIVGADSQFLNATHANLAIALRRLGRLDEALVHARRGLALALQFGEQHPETIMARNDVAQILAALQRTDEARAELERAIAAAKVAGKGRPQLESTLAELLADQGRWAEAHPHFAAAVESSETTDVANLLARRANLANSLRVRGDHAEAERMLREVLAERTRILGPDHADVGTSHLQLGLELAAIGRTDDAAREHAAALAIFERANAPTHVLAEALLAQASVERRRGKPARALELDRRALAILEAEPSKHRIAVAQIAIADDQLALGARAEAEALAARALAALGDRGNPDAVGHARWVLARATRDPERARSLAELARADLERAGLTAARLEVERFLAR